MALLAKDCSSVGNITCQNCRNVTIGIDPALAEHVTKRAMLRATDANDTKDFALQI